MSKKILCVVITLFMMIQCCAVAYANAWTDSVDVKLDMEVKRTSGAVFQNGPISVTGVAMKVDFKTTLETQNVYEKFLEWYGRSLRIIDNMVLLDNTLNRDDLVAQLNAMPITGEFVVNITYPKKFRFADAFVTGGNMYGFNEDAKKAYYEISRTSDTSGSDENVITIVIGVKNEAGGTLLAGELYDNRDVYLADISLTAEDISLTTLGTYTVRGTLSGYTEVSGVVGSKNTSLRVDYMGSQAEGRENPLEPETISATIELQRAPGSQSSSGSGSSSTSGRLVFNIDGSITEIPALDKVNIVKYEDLPKPEKAAHTFDGWYYDSTHQNKVEGDVTVRGVTTLYGHWVSDILDTEDHFAYVIGYPDGLVRPEDNITREEVATIFYRLLREEKRINIAATENEFTDVEVERWSNKAISSLAKDGFVDGYADGSFRPGNYITRAEFATVATRFDELTDKSGVFKDIAGHWAEEYILKAAHEGWVQGYEDGTFGPDKFITRAEVMTIINRMLVRYVDSEGLHKDTKFWPDMDENDWYYYNVLEATNAHKYERKEDGKLERWLEITPNKIWIELDEMENAD